MIVYNSIMYSISIMLLSLKNIFNKLNISKLLSTILYFIFHFSSLTYRKHFQSIYNSYKEIKKAQKKNREPTGNEK